jgi:DNA-binding MarR family transcriptional regulator
MKPELTRVDTEILIFLNKCLNKRNNTVSRLHFSLNRTLSHTTKRVSLLINKGFIYRKKGTSKREKYIYLTRKGKELSNEIYNLKKLISS